MRKRNWILILIIVIVIVGIGVDARYNIVHNPDFFITDIISLCDFLALIIISFVLVQFFTDERRKIDAFERVVTQIESDILDDELISDNRLALILQSSAASRILFLEKHCRWSNIVPEIEYISSKFKELREEYALCRDSGNLEDHRDKLRRIVINIKDKCENIRLLLFERW